MDKTGLTVGQLETDGGQRVPRLTTTKVKGESRAAGPPTEREMWKRVRVGGVTIASNDATTPHRLHRFFGFKKKYLFPRTSTAACNANINAWHSHFPDQINTREREKSKTVLFVYPVDASGL